MEKREIKFRVWDYKESRMSKCFTFASGAVQFGTESVPLEFVAAKSKITGRFLIQQFTGLHDKNGVEIYEGDILSFTPCGEEELLWVDDVIFCDGAFQVEVRGEDYDITAVGWVDDEIELEVIGNVHENPELLEKESKLSTSDAD